MTASPPSGLVLADVPAVVLEPTESLWRVHRLKNHPAYFSAGNERFDPPPRLAFDYGVCYLSCTQEGAFLETLGRIRPLVESAVHERACTEMRVVRKRTLADLTDPTVIGSLGIAGDLSTSEAYSLAHEWSASLWDAGFEGIRYAARFDPSFESRSIALFGGPGQQLGVFEHPKLDDCEPIDSDLIERMRLRYGIRVLPSVPLI